jgi:hypothetical protein
VETETIIYPVPIPSIDYIKYEVDAKRCYLRVTDTVSPETVVGWHYQSGETVEAGFHGHVATMYFNPMHDSMMVMIAVAASGSAVVSEHKFGDVAIMCPEYCG